MKEKQIKDIVHEALQPIFEMSSAWTDDRSNRCVWVENPNGYSNRYFKYLNNSSYRRAKLVARIWIDKPEYVKGHKNSDGKTEWILTSKEKKELVTLLNAPSEAHDNTTNWQEILITYNEDNFQIPPMRTIKGNIDFSKYRNQKPYDINTPMPNYLEL
jgi:hypothetical protein